ncbi:MAG: hypothetical protein AB7F21_03100 [Desulfuromonadales bacterium]
MKTMKTLLVLLIGSLFALGAPLAAEAHDARKKVVVVKEVSHHQRSHQQGYGAKHYRNNQGKGQSYGQHRKNQPPRWGHQQAKHGHKKHGHYRPAAHHRQGPDGVLRVIYGAVIPPSGYGAIDLRIPW